MEIKSLIEDFQMQAMGGMMAAWKLREKALIPSLLSGSGRRQEAVDLCDDIQHFFWRLMYQNPVRQECWE